jgi:hypothetical protein
LEFCKEDNEHNNELALKREKWQGDDLVEGDKFFTNTTNTCTTKAHRPR